MLNSYLRQGHVAIAAPTEGTNDAHLFAQASMLRIKQANGLDFSTVFTTSLLRPLPLCHSASFS